MWTVKEVPAYRKSLQSPSSRQSTILEFFWRWRQQYPLNRRYKLTTLQGAIAQKTQKAISTSVTVSDITSFKHFLPPFSSWQFRLSLHAIKDKFKNIFNRTRDLIEILKMFVYLSTYIRHIVVCIFLDCNKYVFTVIPLMSVSVVLFITLTHATPHLKIPRRCHS
jgi:hypothetical protein